MDSEAEKVFDSMKVKDLKLYLQSKGQLLSGKKDDLIKRAKGTHRLFEHTNVAYQDFTVQTKDLDGAEYFHVASLQNWMKVEDVIVSEWPNITEKELLNYMVYSREIDYTTGAERMKNARRQLKAKVFYEDRHVHSLKYHTVNDNAEECYIKASVIPSAASSDKAKYPDHSVWIRVSKCTGHVIKAYCTCTAGLEGACNHVAALLYALIAMSDKKVKGLDSVTSEQCKWNQPRKRKLSPQKAENLTHKVTKVNRAMPELSTTLVEKLKQFAPHCGFIINYTASKVKELPKKLPEMPAPDFFFKDNVNLSCIECRKIFEKFSNFNFGAADRWLIENSTRGQANNPLWFLARSKKITSSVFGKIVKRNLAIQPISLIKNIMGYCAGFSTEHTAWGKSCETLALKSYIEIMKKTHIPLTVKKCGLILDPNFPYLASSPDGFVQCNHCSPCQGLVEVKCPSKHRGITPAKACLDPNFCCQLVDNKVTLKKTHIYYYQVQGQMAISGRTWCDFVIWTTKGILVERTHFDRNLWNVMLKCLKEFYILYIIPEIFTERVKRNKSLY